MPRALAIVYAFGVTACFVDQPPPQGSTGGSSAASSSASTGTSSAPGASTGQATADASGGSSAGDTSGQGTTDPAATTTTTTTTSAASSDASTSTEASTSSAASTASTSSQTGTTSTSDTSGGVDPAVCAATKEGYTCFLCCAGAFPGVSIYQKALKTCLCDQGHLCNFECGSSLCMGANPDLQCYNAGLSPPPELPCTLTASLACMNDAACGLFLDCYSAANCGSKP